ncbi:transmembrane emp24 domain-containing protein p24delta7 [Neltuma alba]|uniref:transmembrane emp24 domain-containing protein p24delta7 n=1 Tax=Neltuma alba TaxID=207710 RepID=UPI0010A40C65|nr:transmembrane emp24 domain-containing protein p24delta7 [Prosopis alba]
MSGFNHLRLGLLVVVVGLLSSLAESFRFELPPGRTKCITEDITSNSMTVGKYHIVPVKQGRPPPDDHRINVRVTSMLGKHYHSADHVMSGEFAFMGVEAGDYMTCFWTSIVISNLTIDFDWKIGVVTKGWSGVVKKAHIDLLELELLKMQGTVSSIRNEMHYLRSREKEMQELNLSTNDRMLWFSSLSLLICLSVVGLQVWHLKTYFLRKKIL